MTALQSTPNVRLVPVSRADADKMVADRKVKTAVIVPADAEQSIKSNGTAVVTVLVDEGNDVSQAAGGRIEGQLKTFAAILTAQRLKRQGLPAQFGSPIAVNDQPVKGGSSGVMFLLSMIIPYVLALSAFSGGMYAANDQIAGEKERGTLETLLVSPASRREIVMGKFAAIACVCLLSGILSVIGLAIPLLSHSGLFPEGPGGASSAKLSLNGMGIATMILAQVPLTLLFAGLLVAVSSIARNQKEVQVYQMPMMMAILVPAMGSMFVTTEAPLSMALIPVLNSTLVIKQVLAGVSNPAFLLVALLSSTFYAAIGIFISVRLFDNERVLLKT